MEIYIIFFSVLILIVFLSAFRSSDKKINKFFLSFLGILFFLFIGFRHNGYDYISYLDIYQDIQNGYDVGSVESGFRLLCTLAPSYRILLLLVAILTIVLHFTFIYKMSDLPIFSVFLLVGTFLFTTFMGQMRQGISIGFVIWAFYFLKDKRYILFLVSVGIAMTFHFSAILSLVFAILPRRILSLWYYLITILIAAFISIFMEQFILNLASFLPSIAAEKLTYYNETENFELGFNLAILIRAVVLSLSYYYKDKIQNKHFSLLLNIYHLSIIIYLALGVIPQLGGRASLYFAYFDLLLIPFIIKASSGASKYIITSGFFLLTILRVVQFFLSDFNYNEFVPYFKYI